jgi:hypothetical protein
MPARRLLSPSMCKWEASIGNDAAPGYSELKLCDLGMESTEARKCMYGRISALDAFACQIPSAPVVTAWLHILERVVQGSGSSYRIDLTGYANRKCLPSLTLTRLSIYISLT